MRRLGRFLASTEHEQAHPRLLLEQDLLQITVTLACIRRRDADGALAQSNEATKRSAEAKKTWPVMT
ncbi:MULTISPECIES: hypothetical protein [unclassified Thiocapsa]|uniref:hypothetical protein n=1 Tax=unclassified Thiocapsa TaxID=2641286 RepID=UPI0035B23307